MQRFLKSLAILCACTFAATTAFAHAFLDRATPGVGETVQGAPYELTLKFTENIVPAFSGVSLRAAGGGAVPIGKPAISGDVLRVRIGRALKPGTYMVSWHVVSVDTHHTSGTYQFTVTP